MTELIGWQPEETAPKDGSIFLIKHDGEIHFLKWQKSLFAESYWRVVGRIEREPTTGDEGIWLTTREAINFKEWHPLPKIGD